MKRIMTMLAALLAVFTVIGMSGTASAAPPEPIPKWTVRVAIDRTCHAKVTVTWSGESADWLGINQARVHIKGVTDGTELMTDPISLGAVSKGRTVQEFQGWPTDAEQANQAWIEIGGGSLGEGFKTAACTWRAPA